MENENKLIAEFMGFETKISESNISGNPPYWLYLRMVDEEGNKHYSIISLGLPYHEDWNLLMPVVDKIRIWCWDKYNCSDKMGEIFRGMHMVDIARTHIAVVDFINWYNSQGNENAD